MNYCIFDKKIFEDLQLKAWDSPRKRSHFNIHYSDNKPVQKVLISLLHETYIPPYYHVHDNVKLIIFDEDGDIQREIALGDGSDASWWSKQQRP